MSIGALNWAAQTPLTGSARWTLMALANYADDDSGWCFPGQKTIAEWAGISERTAREQLAKLEADGWIERAHRMRDGWRTSDEYVVRFDRFTPPPKERKTLRRDSPVGAADSVVSTGEIRRTEPSVEPPVEPSLEPLSAEASRSTSLPGLEDERVPAARGYKPGRPDVERLVDEVTKRWRTAGDSTVVRNATAQRAALRILDAPHAPTVDRVLAALDAALADEWWSTGAPKIYSWAALTRNLGSLLRMATTGPASVARIPPPPSAAIDPLLGDGELTVQDRERFLIARGVRPDRFFEAGDRAAFLARARRLPVLWRGDDVEIGWLAWDDRLSGTTIPARVPGWIEVRV